MNQNKLISVRQQRVEVQLKKVEEAKKRLNEVELECSDKEKQLQKLTTELEAMELLKQEVKDAKGDFQRDKQVLFILGVPSLPLAALGIKEFPNFLASNEFVYGGIEFAALAVPTLFLVQAYATLKSRKKYNLVKEKCPISSKQLLLKEDKTKEEISSFHQAQNGAGYQHYLEMLIEQTTREKKSVEAQLLLANKNRRTLFQEWYNLDIELSYLETVPKKASTSTDGHQKLLK